LTRSHQGIFSGSVRHLLRTETAAYHAKVDARFTALLRLGKAGYCEFLRLTWAAIYPLEQALIDANVERILPDWSQRFRAAALYADLADLGLDNQPTGKRPSIGGEAYQFGVLYVLEGSRLGARILRRDLMLPTPSAFRYLRHGEGLPLWQTFVKRLEASKAVRLSPEDAIAGAEAAFAYFDTDEFLVTDSGH
jgi:heme oxygenase (biliverdin-IX-beta and delta-forming)